MASATTATTYDAGDRPTQITDSVGGTITRTYDNRFDTPATEVAPLGAGTSTLTYTYDAASRRTLATLPNGVTIDYAYDNANQLTGLTYKRNGITLGISPTATTPPDGARAWAGATRG